MVKCPFCPKKFPTHHGLGGHLSGPCGINLKASKAKAKPKPRPKLKGFPVKVDFGPKMNAELRAEDREKRLAAIPRKVAFDMRKLAAAYQAKAQELERMADRVSTLA